MNFSNFFIRRPIFAGVLSTLIFLVGAIALWRLPVSEYPEVVPPTVVVRALYPGANPKTIAETVASPLEQSVNGVEDSLYMFSQATPDGVMTLTVTFKLGTDVDKAQVQVQNRVAPGPPQIARGSPQSRCHHHQAIAPTSPWSSTSSRPPAAITKSISAITPPFRSRTSSPAFPAPAVCRSSAPATTPCASGFSPIKSPPATSPPATSSPPFASRTSRSPAGAIGQQPVSRPVDFELQINAKGRLVSPEEFGQIVVKVGPNGEKTLLKDIARVELSADSYALRSLLDNKTAVALPIFQLPGANALQLSKDVRAKMDELKANFPDGVDYSVVYDPTVFVRHSIEAVIHTLLEAIILVVIVVIIFLQTWRASLIPLAAVPVSLVGTFAVMLAFGFSINNLSLFGLVLAIGIVVDDAIVVVENVERNIALGLSPTEASKRAMSEVTSPHHRHRPSSSARSLFPPPSSAD